MKKILALGLISIFFLGCEFNDSDKIIQTSEISASSIDSFEHPGKELMENLCYTCHSPSASHEDRLAPPMIAVKKHYLNEGTTKEEFIEDIQAWVKDPNEDNARMFGAVRRFGVMTKTPFKDEDIRKIADYLFDHNIEQPEWFEDHLKEQKGNGRGKGMGHGNGQGKRGRMQKNKG